MGVLHDFVTARVAERATWAQDHLPPGQFGPPPPGNPYWLDVHGQPIIEPKQQVLDDVHAMNVILSVHSPSGRNCTGCGFDYIGDYDYESDNCPVLRALAWRWRAHPQWRTVWGSAGR